MAFPMRARFNSLCKSCGGFIAKGHPILFTPGYGAVHQTQGQCAAAAKPAAKTPAADAPVLNLSAVVTLLNTAKANGLKYPKVRFIGPTGNECRLAFAGATSKYPGAIQIKSDYNWLGRIEADGKVAGPAATDPAMVAILTNLGADPEAEAKRYAAVKGSCCYCNRSLTDAGSVEAGYGPDCAEHYGRPHKAKGTPQLAQVATQAA